MEWIHFNGSCSIAIKRIWDKTENREHKTQWYKSCHRDYRCNSYSSCGGDGDGDGGGGIGGGGNRSSDMNTTSQLFTETVGPQSMECIPHLHTHTHVCNIQQFLLLFNYFLCIIYSWAIYCQKIVLIAAQASNEWVSSALWNPFKLCLLHNGHVFSHRVVSLVTFVVATVADCQYIDGTALGCFVPIKLLMLGSCLRNMSGNVSKTEWDRGKCEKSTPSGNQQINSYCIKW